MKRVFSIISFCSAAVFAAPSVVQGQSVVASDGVDDFLVLPDVSSSLHAEEIRHDDVLLSPSANPLTIDILELNLQPNLAGQSFDIHVDNSAGSPFAVNGFALNIQIADGGPDVGGSIDGPVFTSVDILSGTAFDSNNNGQAGGGVFTGGQVAEAFTATSGASTVDIPSGQSKVATVTVSTEGFFAGVFTMTVANSLNGSSKFETTGTPSTEIPVLIDGSITIVPEPAEYALALAACMGLFAIYRRSRVLPGVC